MQALTQRFSTTALLAAIMAVIVAIVAGVSLLILSDVVLDAGRARLRDTAQSQARLIEAVARVDGRAIATAPETATEAAFARIRAALDRYEGLGDTGEFTLGRWSGDHIEFLLSHRHPDLYPPELFPPSKGLAEPMRRALAGESGTMIGPDYRGVTVLAAHEPVAVLDMGLVAKIDLAEVRAPFLRAAYLIAALTLALVAAGSALFSGLAKPLLQKLRRSEERLELATSGTGTGLWDWPDTERDPCWLSDQFYTTLGYRPGEFPATGEQFWSMMHPDDVAPTRAALQAHLERGDAFDVEYRLRAKAGDYRWLQARGTSHRKTPGGPVRMAGYSHDITARKRVETSLEDVNRALRMISECNQALVRAQDETELALSICRSIVEIGGYVLAWVGYPDDDAERPVRPIASAGDAEGYLQAARAQVGGDAFSYGPLGKAMRTGEPVVVDDIEQHPDAETSIGAGRTLGYRSCIALPLIYQQQLLGALEIKAGAPHAFSLAQPGLLRELADDLAFGIVALRSRERERRAREDAEAGQERLQTIVEHLAEALLVVAEETLILFANPAAESLFGRPRQQLVGSPFGLPALGRRIASAMILRPDGTQVSTDLRSIAIDWEGSPAWVVSLRDVTERERAEEDLRKLSYAVEQSPSSIVITDRDGRIEFVNQTFTDVTGYSREEALGANPRMLQSGKTSPDEYRRLWRAITSGEKWRGEFLNKRKDGELFWGSMSISPIFSTDGEITHFIGIQEDITELKQTREQLLQAQKMEVVGSLTGGIAHDFNNMLGVVLGNLQLIERRLQTNEPAGADERVLKRLATAIGAVMRGADLTRRLLAFSRRQVLEPCVLDLGEVVEGTLSLLERALGESIEVRVATEPTLWPVHLDRGQLESALLNLAVNARDAMPDGGVLMIETANVQRDARDTRGLIDVEPGDYVMLGVSDTGFGMPPEVRAHVFEPFFTTKEVGKGTGLGLSMVYGFVKQSKGYVNIYSEPGMGTSVKLYFRRASGVALPATEREEDVEIPAGDETLLLVEDDPDLRESAAEFLAQLGYRVLTADSGPAAVEGIQTEPRVALLFTDVIMPGGMSGADLARRALELRPELPVLFTSGYARNALSDTILKEIDAEVIQKPYGMDGLARRIRKMLDSRKK